MNLSDGFRLLLRTVAPQRRALIRLALWSLVEATPPLVSGLLVARAIDRGFLAAAPWAGLGWLLLFLLAQLVATVATRKLYPWLAETVEPVRDALMTALVSTRVRQSVARARPPSGAAVTQATEQIETVRTMLSSLLRNARQFVSAAVALVGLAVLSPIVAAMVVPMVLLAALVFVRMLRMLVARQREVVLAGESVGGTASPLVEGIRDVVACGAQERCTSQVEAAVQRHAEAARAFARARVARVLVLAAGVHLPVLALLAMSPWLISHGWASVGVLGGAVVYLAQQLEPALRFLVNAGGNWIIVLAVFLARLDHVTSSAEKPEQRGGSTSPARCDFSVQNLRFSYSSTAVPVIDDLSFDVAEGTHLAVVGPSGTGKSTVANLLTGVSAPDRGAVRVGGTHAPADLRGEIALIPQESYIFAGTVRENLAYLREEVGDDELTRVAALLGLDEALDRLGGLDADIPPAAACLSAGERQLVALARVHCSPARIIVLDEATSHLDPVTEARVETAFADRGGTLVVIAHRISSAMRADHILLMDGDRTVLGTHEELVTASTLYADLVGHWNGAPQPRELVNDESG